MDMQGESQSQTQPRNWPEPPNKSKQNKSLSRKRHEHSAFQSCFVHPEIYARNESNDARGAFNSAFILQGIGATKEKKSIIQAVRRGEVHEPTFFPAEVTSILLACAADQVLDWAVKPPRLLPLVSSCMYVQYLIKSIGVHALLQCSDTIKDLATVKGSRLSA
jgi:hypothetical protein